MAAETLTPAIEPVVDEESLKKAEEFIEAEEGATHRFKGGWGTFLGLVAVAMSLYHLYAAYGIVTTTTLRYVHVGFMLFLVFTLFPATRAATQSLQLGRPRLRVARGRDRRVRDPRRRRLPGSQHDAEPGGHVHGRRAGRARARGGAARDRLGHAVRVRSVHCLRDGGALPARAVDAPRLRRGASRRHDVHDARGHIRHGDRRVVLADHPVHDLRRVPAVLGRRQVLRGLFAGRVRRQAHGRGARDRGLVVPARRALGLRRRHDGDARERRLPDARQSRLRKERRGRTARGRRAGRDPVAAGARRRGVPDRGVPEDLLPRRDQDGGHPDLPVLPVACS